VGELTLPEQGLVYLDSNAIIYSVEKVPEYWPKLKPVWQASAEGRLKLVTSELAILESLVLPMRLGNAGLIADYEEVFHSQEVELVPITANILREAASMRAKHKAKTPDSIHLATALSIQCKLCLTNDLDFRRVPDVPVAILSQM
jgi:predicted nucleic acid-binding protein